MLKKSSIKKMFLTPVLLLAAGAFLLLFSLVKADGQSAKVTAADLTAAGFSAPQLITPVNGKYLGSNLYFSLTDKLASSSEPDQVMVDYLTLPYMPSDGALFSYGSDSHTFPISGGAGREATIADGRTAINFIKGYNYIVVVGPKTSKVESLATTLASKIQ